MRNPFTAQAFTGMRGFPLSSRPLLGLGAIVGVLALVQVTRLAGWLSRAGMWAISLLVPIVFVAVALVGIWSEFKYVRERGWQG